LNPCPEISPTTGTVHALRMDLTEPSGWPVAIPMNGDIDSSPAIADLNGDLYADVIVGSSNGNLYCLSGNNGQNLTGFPFNSGAPIYSSPVVGDLNNDGNQDIIFGNDAGYLYGLSSVGALLDGFPMKTGNKISAAAFIWDIDGNGTTEIGVRGSDQILYCWGAPWPFSSTHMAWPKFKKNSTNDGNRLGSLLNEQTGIQDNVGGRIPSLLFANPSRNEAAFTIFSPERSKLEVLDISGRIVHSELLEGRLSQYQIRWRGVDANGRRLSAGIYFVRIVGRESVVKKLLLLR